MYYILLHYFIIIVSQYKIINVNIQLQILLYLIYNSYQLYAYILYINIYLE